DTDGDGTGNNTDKDDDNDGIPDIDDQFPTDNTAAGDTDGDGIDDLNDDDIDGDGIRNEDDNDANGDGIIDDNAINSPPIAQGDVVDVYSIEPVTINVLANDSDINQDILSVTSVSTRIGQISFNNNQVTYTAPENFTGNVIAKYTVTDGIAATQGNILLKINTFDSTGQAPLVLPPEDITVNATGLFTRVELGLATATDSKGNRLPVSLVDGLTLFKPGKNIAYWEAEDESGNRTVSAQQVSVRPLVSFGKDQIIEEGAAGKVKIVLNGESPEYPLAVSFLVSGTASNDDHSLRPTTVLINSGVEASVKFMVTKDDHVEGDETITLAFTGELNAVHNASSRITITENKLRPTIDLNVKQRGQSRLTVAKDDGQITILSSIVGGEGETFLYSWSSNPEIQDMDNIPKNFSFMPENLNLGIYKLTLNAYLDNSAAFIISKTIEINLVDHLNNLSATQDTDGDNIPDSEEGYNDSDGDGIPDYADSISQRNVIPARRHIENAFLVEGEPGVSLRIGATSLLNQMEAALVESTALANADFDYSNIGGIFDFEVRDLPTIGQSTKIVLPQQRPIPEGSTYRKYNGAAEWVNFVEDNNNALSSTPGEIGYCPPPNSAIWSAGLTAGDWCVRLTIEDGGANDADEKANGSIVDPGGIGIPINNNQFPIAQNDVFSMRYNTSALIDVLANDSDPDGETLTIVGATSEIGAVSIENNKLLFTPIEDYFGDAFINYSISDGSSVYSYANVEVTIFVNEAPIAENDSADTDNRTPITVDVLANDSDPDGDLLTIIKVEADKGTVNIVDGKLLYTPDKGIDGNAHITYTIADPRGLTANGLLTINVDAFEVIEIKNNQKSSGGAMGSTFGFLLSLLIIVRRFALGTAIFSILGLNIANAQTKNDWSLNVGVFHSKHDESKQQLGSKLMGIGGELTKYDNNNTGYELGVVYTLNQKWLFTAGFRHFGELDNIWTINTSIPEKSISDVQAVMPTLGSGFYLGAGYRYAFSKKVFAQLILEAQQWRQELTTSASNVSPLTLKRNGVDPSISAGIGYQVSDTLNLLLNARKVQFGSDSTRDFSLNIEWKFSE
ncbi:MAG: Ig-like domain-containing protein, partial [Cognaticolwellia aestuarii]